MVIIKKSAFPDNGSMMFFDIEGHLHMVLKTSSGNYIHLQSGHILVKIETAHLVILVG